LSDVTGLPNETLVTLHDAEAFTVMFAGAVIVGIVLSRTVMICEAVEVFPTASVAVQVTIVVPIGYTAGALFVTVTALQLSEVEGVPKETPVAAQDALAETVIGAGGVMIGSVLS
jgi:hypothetical protein